MPGIRCDHPGMVRHGRMSGEFRHGARVMFTCDTGFELQGDDIIQCQADGSWDGNVPDCVGKIKLPD